MTPARSRPGGGLLAVVASIAVLTGCSVAEHLTAPFCEGQSSSAIIAVQSVPSATLVPCLDPLPAGWEVARTDIDETGTTVLLDSDRAGAGAARFHFVASCDPTGAIEVPSVHPDTARYELVHSVGPRFRSDRFHVFTGGCVWWEFDFDPEAPAALSVELGNTLQLASRQEVNAVLRETFVDAEL